MTNPSSTEALILSKTELNGPLLLRILDIDGARITKNTHPGTFCLKEASTYFSIIEGNVQGGLFFIDFSIINRKNP